MPMLPKRLLRHGLVLGWVVGSLLLAGCVSEEIQPEYIPRVSTSQNAKGMVTLSWPSRVGYTYWIYVRNEQTQIWEPLKGAKVYVGTGDMISVEDQQTPGKPLPWYSVRAKPTRK